MQKVHTSRKIRASTTLGNLKLQIEPPTQYLHVHFNESLNSHKHTCSGSYCLKNCQTCSKYITSSLHHMLEIRLPPTQTLADDVAMRRQPNVR